MINIFKYTKTIVIAKNILIIVLSAFLTSCFNLCNLLSFVPQNNKYTVSLSIYLAILGIIWDSIYKSIEKNHMVEIEIKFNIKNEFEETSKVINYGFNKLDLAEIYGQIKINASPKKLRKMNLMLIFPPWICVQEGLIGDKVLNVEKHNNCRINFKNLLNENSMHKKNSIYEFKLYLIKDVPANTGREDDIEYELNYQDKHFSKFFIDFKHNTIHLKSN